MDHDHPLTLSSTPCPSFLMSVSWCFETPLWPTWQGEGEGSPQVPLHLVPYEPNWTQHKLWRGVTTMPPFCPPRAVLTPRPGQVPFGRGLWPPKRQGPGPIFCILNPLVPQRPLAHLKLISDLGPWGSKTSQEIPTASPPPSSLPSGVASAAPVPVPPISPPRHPNMPLHCSRVGRQAAAGPLDGGTLMQAMHAALAGAWGGQAPWPTGEVVHAGCRSKGPATGRLARPPL